MYTGCGHLYVTINKDDDGRIFEVFTQIGKTGGCAASQSEAIGRLISLAFRINIEPQEIIRQLTGIRCHSPAWTQGERILSCADALGQAIEKAINTDKKDVSFDIPKSPNKDLILTEQEYLNTIVELNTEEQNDH
jgi:ribonucleoside-diphosphate reductase alpha chain